MKCQITGKNITVTDSIRNVVESKLSKMDKYFIVDDEVEAKVLVRTYKQSQKIEVTIFTKVMDFRVEVKHDDLYAAIDLAIDKLEGQMRKLKTRLDRKTNKHGLGESIAFENIIAEEEEESQDEVVRTKGYHLEPMDIEEAITRMNALGHDFFMYLDEEDNMISVVYVRKDGGYGVIQAENKLA